MSCGSTSDYELSGAGSHCALVLHILPGVSFTKQDVHLHTGRKYYSKLRHRKEIHLGSRKGLSGLVTFEQFVVISVDFRE